MAQIVTITNPLTGQPAQVDQLEHTAQQIDDAIARALPGGAIDIALQNKLGGIESTDYPGCYYRMIDGVVEWVNPPMELGEEYRTTERYLGKTVYVKAVDLGNAVSGGNITVTNWLPNSIKILRAMGSIALSKAWTEGAGMSIIPSYPYGLTGSNTAWDVYIKEADLNKVVVYTGASQVERKVIVTAWYTKD